MKYELTYQGQVKLFATINEAVDFVRNTPPVNPIQMSWPQIRAVNSK